MDADRRLWFVASGLPKKEIVMKKSLVVDDSIRFGEWHTYTKEWLMWLQIANKSTRRAGCVGETMMEGRVEHHTD